MYSSYYEKFADGTVKCIDEEIPFEIPSSWEWCRLGYVYQHNTGKALNAANTAGCPKKYLTTSNVYWDLFDFAAVKEMPFTDDELAKYTVKKGDLLVCEGGDIGRAAIWPYDYEICIQNHIHRLRGYVELCTYYFYNIFWLYKRNGVIGGKGIGIQGLSAGVLHNILVPIPPLNEQYRIVKRLEEYSDLLNLYDSYKTKLDEMEAEFLPTLRKSILQYAIQGKLVPQNPNDKPASELLNRIEEEKNRLVREGKIKRDKNASYIFKGEDNKYFEKKGDEIVCISDELPFDIPETWEWVRLGNCCKVIGGYAFKSHEIKAETGHRVIRISDISDDGLVNNSIVRYNGVLDLSKYQIFNNDILIAMTGGTVGKSMMYKSQCKETLLLNQRVAIIRSNLISPLYINTIIKSPYIQEIINKAKNSTNDNISMADICGFLIPLPPLREQKRIIDALNNVLTSIMRK